MRHIVTTMSGAVVVVGGLFRGDGLACPLALRCGPRMASLRTWAVPLRSAGPARRRGSRARSSPGNRRRVARIPTPFPTTGRALLACGGPGPPSHLRGPDLDLDFRVGEVVAVPAGVLRCAAFRADDEIAVTRFPRASRREAAPNQARISEPVPTRSMPRR
jgi:hypothetical protein